MTAQPSNVPFQRENLPAVDVDQFEVAAGSVPGREHLRLKRGSQDAFSFRQERDCLVAVVCDGCGSGAHSEVGAKLGARLLVSGLIARLADGREPSRDILAAAVREDLLSQLEFIATAIGGDPRDVISEYFLFTVVGAVITPTITMTFSIGDGLVAVNGKCAELGPFNDNQPPYPAYELLCPGFVDTYLEVHTAAPTAGISSMVLASDGALDLRDPLDEFWRRDLFFRNRDAVRRRLTIVNRDTAESRGPLLDDTTLISIRRRRDR